MEFEESAVLQHSNTPSLRVAGFEDEDEASRDGRAKNVYSGANWGDISSLIGALRVLLAVLDAIVRLRTSEMERPAWGLILVQPKRERALVFMADVANKYPQNVAGKFYVDDQCIDCDLCRETAPANFTRDDDGGHSYVFKQPENAEEEALCKEAMEGCPVEAIGSDGE
jgi:ferredoxin